MHFSSSAIALAVIGFTSALPANTYSSTPTNCSTSSSTPSVSCTSSPTPSACKTSCPPPPNCNTSCSPPAPSNIIRPTYTSQYDVWTGAVRYSTQKGKIFKNGHTTDITTLLTFDFPAEAAGKTCSFHFDLASDPTAKVSGTAQFDVFTSLAPAAYSTTTWPSGNLRDQHFGRMTARLNGEATWVDGFSTIGKSFPCPAGQTYGGELVGTGDVDHIEWLAANSGPHIKW